MSYPKLLGLTGLITTALLLAGMHSLALGGTGADVKHATAFDQCAKACADCMRECESCAHHCAHLLAEGKKDHLHTLGTCTDCAEVCSSAARIVSRHGPLAVPICEMCTKACDTCAAACEKFPDDPHMQRCARECLVCAKACREMIEHAGSK